MRQVKCNKIMNVFFLACRMNAQLLKIYWCDIQSLGFDCLHFFFWISYTLYNAFYELFFFQSSIIMNYLFNDIISSDRNNTEDEKESNNSQVSFPTVSFPLQLISCWENIRQKAVCHDWHPTVILPDFLLFIWMLFASATRQTASSE